MSSIFTLDSKTQSESKSSGTSEQSQTVSEIDSGLALIDAVAPRLWLAQEHHVTTGNTSLVFEGCDWLIDLYCDESQEIVVVKSSQSMISEWLICEMFSRARQGNPGMYILPTGVFRNRFVPRRVDKLVNRVPLYMANYSLNRKDSDTKSQKVFWEQDWRFAGANSPDDFYEFPCNTLLFDEYDLCLAKAGGNLQLAFDRLGKAALSTIRIVYVGNPTRTGHGIHAKYEMSDKKVHLVKCPHCNERQPMLWFVNFVREDETGWSLMAPGDSNQDAAAVCRKCERPMNRIASGEWVAEFRDREISGYQISKTFADNRAGMVMQAMFDRFIKAQGDPTLSQIFYNNELGEPYRADGAAITLDILTDCIGDYNIPTRANGTYAGADVGKTFAVQVDKIIKGVPSLIFAGTLSSYDELDQISRRFGVSCGVIDALPEVHATPEFLKTHPQWYQCFYNLPATTKLGLESSIQVDHRYQTVRVNRTASMDGLYRDFNKRLVRVPRHWLALDNGDYAKQMTAATRVFNEAKDRYEWVEGDSPDHHHHAANYKRIAYQIGGGDMVIVA